MSNVQAQNPSHWRRFAPYIERALELDWRPEDVEVAQSEGWDLFDNGGADGHADFELCRCDDLELFDGDAEAWRHVARRAAAGSPTHVRALAFLAIVAPEDLQGIFYDLYYGEYRTYLPRRS